MIQKGVLIILIIGLCMGFVVALPINNPAVVQNSAIVLQGNQDESAFAVISTEKSKTINVLTSISGYPKKAHKGQDVKFKFVITNNGTKPIYNVRIDSQNIYKKLGTIKPGQSKTVIKSIKIYSNLNGGQGVYYTDYKGKVHHTNFKDVYIKLV